MKYRPDIDGLRAVAVLSVVFNHAFEGLVPGGFVGVDVFFVISGFLISNIISQEAAAGKFSYFDFYSRRARRILPALATVLIVSAIFVWTLYLPNDFASFWKSVIYSALFSANFFFMVEIDYFAAPMEFYPLLHLWSLAVEEQFYIVMPILILAVTKYVPRRLPHIIVALCVISFVTAEVMLHLHQKSVFYMMPFRFWELGLGAMLSLMPAMTLSRAAREAGAALGLILLGASFWMISPDTLFPGAAALAPCLGAALLIAAGPQTRVNRALAFGPVVWVGLISYSLYLWHWPVLVFARYALMRAPEPAETAALIVLSILLAAASLRFVERPFRTRAMGAASPRRVTGAAALVLVALCSVSVGAMSLDGAPGRWRVEALEILKTGAQRNYADVTLCRSVRDKAVAVDGLCRIGAADGRPDFLLWGDSHALALQPGFELAAARAGLTGLVVTKHACSPLLGLDRADLPFWHRCAAHNDQVLALIAKTRPRAVYLASRWSLVSIGEGFGDERKLRIRYDGDGNAPGLDLLRRTLARTLAAVKATGAQPVVVDPIPVIGWDVPTTLARALEWGRPRPAPLSRAAYDERQASTRAVILSDAREAGARVIDPVDVLCDSDICVDSEDGASFYKDNNHLSGLGARRLAGLIAADVARR
jgi:peptidoglycan/LPS O-acetylase OafA/YrhL